MASAIVIKKPPKHLFRSAKAVQKANRDLVVAIDKVPREWQWSHIVIHHTAVIRGSLAGIDRYHRGKFADGQGIEYHFLIGNGHSAPDGLIELGRWQTRARSIHVAYPARAPLAITVSLMGNLHVQPPSQAQMFATELLLRRLMRVYGITPDRVSTNTRVDGRVTVCPGRHFPIDNLLWRLRHVPKLNQADWRPPWPDVQMDGPYPNLQQIRHLLRPRYSCPRGMPPFEALTSYSAKRPGGGMIEARLFSVQTGHRCEPITRRMLGLRTKVGWFVRETNGYRKGRLKVRRKRGRVVVQLVDGRGVMITCARTAKGPPACATTTSGRKAR